MRPGYFIFGIFTENTKHFYTFNPPFSLSSLPFSLSWYNHLILLLYCGGSIEMPRYKDLNYINGVPCVTCAFCTITLKIIITCAVPEREKRKNKIVLCHQNGQLLRSLACIHSMARFCMSKFMLNDICYVHNRHFMLVNLAVFLFFSASFVHTSLDQLLLSLHCI